MFGFRKELPDLTVLPDATVSEMSLAAKQRDEKFGYARKIVRRSAWCAAVLAGIGIFGVFPPAMLLITAAGAVGGFVINKALEGIQYLVTGRERIALQEEKDRRFLLEPPLPERPVLAAQVAENFNMEAAAPVKVMQPLKFRKPAFQATF